MNVALMLELYRRAAVPFVAENVRLFKAMPPADQARAAVLHDHGLC
jgi:hypothetical protein